MTRGREHDFALDRWRAPGRWPQIEVRMLGGACAEATVIGILGYSLSTDVFDPYDLESIRRSARWLGVSSTRLYDLTVAARVGAA